MQNHVKKLLLILITLPILFSRSNNNKQPHLYRVNIITTTPVKDAAVKDIIVEKNQTAFTI